jgi:hypothetical protein
MWIEANQLQPLPRVDEKVAPGTRPPVCQPWKYWPKERTAFPPGEAYMIEDIVETSVIR